MGKVTEDMVSFFFVLKQQFKSSCGAFECLDSLVKLLVTDANLLRHIACSIDILHVMLSEYLHLLLFSVWQNQDGVVAIGFVRMNIVAVGRNASIFSYFLCFDIVSVINQASTVFDGLYEDFELLEIAVKRRENIDVIPPYSTNYSDM